MLTCVGHLQFSHLLAKMLSTRLHRSCLSVACVLCRSFFILLQGEKTFQNMFITYVKDSEAEDGAMSARETTKRHRLVYCANL